MNWTKEKFDAALLKVDDTLANMMTNSTTQAANKAVYVTLLESSFEKIDRIVTAAITTTKNTTASYKQVTKYRILSWNMADYASSWFDH